jgi:hypothetical protein
MAENPVRAAANSQQEAEEAETQQRGGVVSPTLLYLFLDAGSLVREYLEPAQNGMHEGALSSKTRAI